MLENNEHEWIYAEDEPPEQKGWYVRKYLFLYSQSPHYDVAYFDGKEWWAKNNNGKLFFNVSGPKVISYAGIFENRKDAVDWGRDDLTKRLFSQLYY